EVVADSTTHPHRSSGLLGAMHDGRVLWIVVIHETVWNRSRYVAVEGCDFLTRSDSRHDATGRKEALIRERVYGLGSLVALVRQRVADSDGGVQETLALLSVLITMELFGENLVRPVFG